MTTQGFDRAAERYRLEVMISAVPTDRSELVIGFTPWAEDTEGWPLTVRRRRPEAAGERRLGRTVWDDPDQTGARVLIDVYECDSTADAVRALVEVLAGNHLAVVPEGPAGLGLFSFVQPEGLPPAVMMVRANACLVVSSFGSVDVDVLPWARRLDTRIQERPETVEEASILEEDTPREQGGEALVRVTPRWSIGEDGYVKVFASGGTLELSEGRVAVQGEGEVTVDAYILEPGRPIYGSSRRVTAG